MHIVVAFYTLEFCGEKASKSCSKLSKKKYLNMMKMMIINCVDIALIQKSGLNINVCPIVLYQWKLTSDK
jgi:hypothetical protein